MPLVNVNVKLVQTPELMNPVRHGVVLPLEGKDSLSLLSGDAGQLFRLRAVIVHRGAAGVGHYTTYVRDQNDLWFHCDDSPPNAPRKSELAEVLEAEAYILVYEQ